MQKSSSTSQLNRNEAKNPAIQEYQTKEIFIQLAAAAPQPRLPRHATPMQKSSSTSQLNRNEAKNAAIQEYQTQTKEIFLQFPVAAPQPRILSPHANAKITKHQQTQQDTQGNISPVSCSCTPTKNIITPRQCKNHQAPANSTGHPRKYFSSFL